jgi:Asp-tRNA(Asn)/Glu-tRNA(Gln) amidotransferase A subunit family amidase
MFAPAAAQGVFGIRTTKGLLELDGIVPVAKYVQYIEWENC